MKNLTKNLISDSVKQTFFIRAFGLTKIPMLFFISPTVVELTDRRCEVRVPLNRKTRNHLRSMYFGTLCAGADCAGGLIAMKLIHEKAKAQKVKISLVFKDFKAEFLKRADGDVHFICEEGADIHALVEKAAESSDRENMTVHVIATVPSRSPDPVAKFELTLSLKRK